MIPLRVAFFCNIESYLLSLYLYLLSVEITIENQSMSDIKRMSIINIL